MRKEIYAIGAAALIMATAPATATSPAAAQAQRPRQAAPAPRIVDLRPDLAKRKWKDGRTIFYSDKYLQLVGEARGGKLISVTPVNLAGPRLRLSTQQGSPKPKRPCIICYNLDQPLASTCIEVPCELLPILKPILNRAS